MDKKANILRQSSINFVGNDREKAQARQYYRDKDRIHEVNELKILFQELHAKL